jgi:hypothetical protein
MRGIEKQLKDNRGRFGEPALPLSGAWDFLLDIFPCWNRLIKDSSWEGIIRRNLPK